MKKIIFMELFSLLILSLLLIPSMTSITHGEPLFEVKSQTTDSIELKEIAAIDFDGTFVRIYYNHLSGFSYSDPNSNWERQKVPVCTADQNKCLYADFYHQFDLRENGEQLEPDHIIEVKEENIDTEIYVYFLDTSSTLEVKYRSRFDDITITCDQPEMCRAAETVTAQDILSLCSSWKEMDEFSRKKYLRYFDSVLRISESWMPFNAVSGTPENSDNELNLSCYQDNQGRHYLRINTSSYYELTETQFLELLNVIGR